MTVYERLLILKREEFVALLHDVEQLDDTGILPNDAPLRKFTEEFFGVSTVLHMTTVSYNIYKVIAMICLYQHGDVHNE